MLDFIYYGEVYVEQDSLNDFLKVTEELAVYLREMVQVDQKSEVKIITLPHFGYVSLKPERIRILLVLWLLSVEVRWYFQQVVADDLLWRAVGVPLCL